MNINEDLSTIDTSTPNRNNKRKEAGATSIVTPSPTTAKKTRNVGVLTRKFMQDLIKRDVTEFSNIEYLVWQESSRRENVQAPPYHALQDDIGFNFDSMDGRLFARTYTNARQVRNKVMSS